MEPLISLQDIGIRYKKSGNIFRKKSFFDTLKSVSFNIYPGETLGILGGNGSGKSTLLRVISGIIQPDTGKIINYGASVSLLSLQAGFDPNLSGRDNAVLSGILQGTSRRHVESCLEEIHEYSGLGDFFHEPVRTYSNGMKARLGFSITTIISPDILLVDEVLSVGDQNFKQKAERTMIAKIQSKQTVVLVTHSHQQIARLCDRAILLDEGISYTSDSPHDVLNMYEDSLKKKNTT